MLISRQFSRQFRVVYAVHFFPLSFSVMVQKEKKICEDGIFSPKNFIFTKNAFLDKKFGKR